MRVLDVDSAYAILEPYFATVQEAFVQQHTRTRRVVLEVAPWVHDSPRHFAACSETGTPILAAPELADLPEETVLAIFAHEFGHAVDFLYPATYMVTDEGELIVSQDELRSFSSASQESRVAQAHLARMRQWTARDADAVERTADAIAEACIGRQIGYCGPCQLQCFDRGQRPRPLDLR